jgi:hypothetical protein
MLSDPGASPRRAGQTQTPHVTCPLRKHKRFNRKASPRQVSLRLDQYIIESIKEALEFATQWLWTYNDERPNMGIGGITPAQKLKMAA